MSDLKELYQEIILDHNRKPRNFKEMDNPTHLSEGYNPLCGDRLTVYLNIDEGMIKDINFLGSGCAISKASASMMTSALKGRSVKEAENLFSQVHEMLTGKNKDQPELDKLSSLAALAGVSEFPMRIKCATLAWHAMKAALEQQENLVSTE